MSATFDARNYDDLATKDDLKDLRFEMQKMRYDLLKWQIGIAIVILTVMAKGFGWLGF